MVIEPSLDNDSENVNPRKRVNGDTPDYPRRRATIAVCYLLSIADLLTKLSVRYVVDVSRGAMALNQDVGFAMS
jgi:hypothetical protein